jgi:hypothetical protein
MRTDIVILIMVSSSLDVTILLRYCKAKAECQPLGRASENRADSSAI